MSNNIMIRNGFIQAPRSWRERFLAIARQAESSHRDPTGTFQHPELAAKSALQPRFSPVGRMPLAARVADA